MRTVKASGKELEELQQAAAVLKAANEIMASAEKSAKAAKFRIAEWLKKERSIELETLPIGEIVNVDLVCLIERGKMNKFDEKSFSLAHAVLHAEFKKDLPVTRWKPLQS